MHPETDRQTDRDREEILIVHPFYRDEKEQMKKLRDVVEMWTRTAEKDFCVIGEGGIVSSRTSSGFLSKLE